MGWPNGAVRTPLRVSVSGSVYTDGMNVNSLGLPGSQAPLDESSTVFVPGDETMSGQRGGGDGKRKKTSHNHLLVDLCIKGEASRYREWVK
jgi:hypothetical protein